MLILPGSRAFSDFNKNKLLNSLQDSIPELTDIHARYWHFVKISEALTEEEKEILTELLHYGEQDKVEKPRGELFLVTPRPGTISPWSSKATDILHNCGMNKVVRVERGVAYFVEYKNHSISLTEEQRTFLSNQIHDRMIEVVMEDEQDAIILFNDAEPKPLTTIPLGDDALAALSRANIDLGLALSDDEIQYLADNYADLKRDPSDVELMMFAQANSEHCRHKIFNADWVIDGKKQNQTLFGMIKNTYKKSPEGILSAYHDNASVVEGSLATRFFPNSANQEYGYSAEPVHMLMKVETHNHPTAISPFPGAATGSGGEIRDEGATGNGSKPKAGLCGFSVSNLKIPEYPMPWEIDHGKPSRIDSALDIMLEGPIGAAAFNNEFGRPNISGYFRTYEAEVPGASSEKELRGYHKPIMLAGGLGNIRQNNIDMKDIPVETPIVVLGGPSMLIGLGGGAASSMASGTSTETLDFASVQRGNPEMERRAQEVIDRCVAMGDNNPILWIHDVGAGGVSNAIPEIVNDAGRGGKFEIRMLPNDEPGMSPMEIWCNEAQERYVLAIDADRLDTFKALCERERAIYAVVGTATEERHLLVGDALFENNPVDMSMDMLLGKPPKMLREVHHKTFHKPELELDEIKLDDAIERVLRLPAVASKSFLITIGDRSITGMVNRDQMVGPWQVPVADVAVTCADYVGYNGEAMALGERTPIALVNPPASGRMAIGEAITNIAAARIGSISDIFLSANWMAAAGYEGEDTALFDTVKAVGEELCPQLGIAIPVGKDSLSMKTVWNQQTDDGSIEREMAAPLSLITTAFAIVDDVRKTLTPQIRTDKGDSDLILIDLGKGKNRLAASALSQVYSQVGAHTPDVNDPQALISFFKVIQELNQEGKLLAYHDRSDGGLLATLCEMAFAGKTGITIRLDDIGETPLEALFTEELGAVIQVHHTDVEDVLSALREVDLGHSSHIIGRPNLKESATDTDQITFTWAHETIYQAPRATLHKIWAETSYRMQALRDNDQCAKEEFEKLDDDYRDTGLIAEASFDIEEDITAPYIHTGARPAVAILREQGVNGQQEMAMAFDRAGFRAVDVHMTDIISGRTSLDDFSGMVACGGFSYGDVLGAGGGWAKTILNNSRAKDEFNAFFERNDVFGLGVCNGCQMLSHLRDLIPGADHWPEFYRNQSEQFEGRFAMVEVVDSPSILLKDMQGSKMPIAVAHGEGRAVFTGSNTAENALDKHLVSMRYIDHNSQPTQHYPENPNGSEQAITGLSNADGRYTIMMPHPERVVRTVSHSWHPDDWGEDSPWMRMFRNARVWVD